MADPTWVPLITTPPYPDHPSGLVGLSGANVRTLQDFFGSDSIAFTDVTTPAAPLPSITHRYASFSQLLQETVDARVWSGIHFRIADEQAAQLGDEVARWREDHGFFRPARDRHDGDEDDHGHDDGHPGTTTITAGTATERRVRRRRSGSTPDRRQPRSEAQSSLITGDPSGYPEPPSAIEAVLRNR